MRAWPGLIALLLSPLLFACTTPLPTTGAGPSSSGPPVEIAGLPYFPQEDGHCGPAALATVLAWAGRPVHPAEVAELLYTPGRGGSFRHDLVTAAARLGAAPVVLASPGDLLAEVEAGTPVLVLQNLGLDWLPVWHFAVVTGFDPSAGEILLRSGDEPRRRISFATFARTWARADHFGLLAMPPGTLPPTADEDAVVRAATRLERVGRGAAAEATYLAALARWPGSRGALIGLGNVRHAAGDRSGAEAALQEAVTRHPGDAVAWNNLAHVLNMPGRRLEALGTSSRAVDIGGRRSPAGITRGAILTELGACRDQGTSLAAC